MKRINVKSTTYTASANVVYKSESGELTIKNSFETEVENKSMRNAKRTLKSAFAAEFGEGCEIVSITDIAVSRTDTTTQYCIMASNIEIVNACIAQGLTVEESGEDTEESENDEN